MPAIVLDKCFLQAASWETIRDLAESNDLIITGSLFHELLSGDIDARRRVFSKLPRRDNPAHLLDNVSALLKHESKTHTPVGSVLDHTLDLSYRFNPRLKEPGYQLSEEARIGVAENIERTRRSVDSYVERTNAIVGIFYRVTTGSDSDRLAALAEIEQEISEPESVMTFYRSVSDPDMPSPDLITSDWATFRSYQTSLLFSLHTLHRHKGVIPLPLSAKEFERLEHDVHDHMALCTGILAGGFATNEKKLKAWYKLLSPEGTLISS